MNGLNVSDAEQSPRRPIPRRQFLGGAVAAAASVPAVLRGLGAESAGVSDLRRFEQKIKLGLIGCGVRGTWIAKLFQAHGGFELDAVADYFPEVVEKAGTELGVEPTRRFSTLSGYRRLLESGVQAVALMTPVCFFPEHAQAAVAAGMHVYMAKPVAVDVPGCLSIENASRTATQKQRGFFVDYQLPFDDANREVHKRIASPGFGRIAYVVTAGMYGGFPDPPRTDTIESRLQKLIWVNDIALGGDYIGNYDIHALDAALWVLKERPVAAMGASRICRPEPHGDSHDVCLVTFEYPSGVLHHHQGQALKNFTRDELSCRIYGQRGNALLNYWGRAEFRSYDDGFVGEVGNIYETSVVRNIRTFYQNIVGQDFQNANVQRAVDGALTSILGRVAGERRQRVTMDELIRENKHLDVDLSGLKT